MSEVGNRGGLGTRATTTTLAGVALIGLFVQHAAVRGRTALLDLSLFRRRGFATSAAANFLLPMALFGTLVLLPLYYQLIRHQDALHVGLLLAPQGAGAALAMPLAGWLTDRIGARVVVVTGVMIGALGTAAFTQVGAHTSYAYLASALLVIGIGIGSTIMPSMAAAFQTLDPTDTPRATSALNTIQRVAGALGTALMAVTLQREITSHNRTLSGGLAALSHATSSGSAMATGQVASAFGATFWVAVGLICAAVVPALLLSGAPPEPRSTTEHRQTPPPGGGVARSEAIRLGRLAGVRPRPPTR